MAARRAVALIGVIASIDARRVAGAVGKIGACGDIVVACVKRFALMGLAISRMTADGGEAINHFADEKA